MSTFCGIFRFDNKPIYKEEIKLMLDSSCEWVPDKQNFWIDGIIGLGHNMLWNTPESLSEKIPTPMTEKPFVYAGDSRIDNREELLEIFKIPNSEKSKTPDSQLILLAYERWGENCPNRLLGDFAFCIYNRKNKKIFLARDHLGFKNICWAKTSEFFVFGSTPETLLARSDIKLEYNLDALKKILIYDNNVGEGTGYKNIYRIRPGHCGSVNAENEHNFKRYWSPNPIFSQKALSLEEASEELNFLLTEAVRCRLRSHYPVASQCSSGLDSSTITCIAAKLLQQKNKTLHTYTSVPSKQHLESMYFQPGDNEGNWVKELADKIPNVIAHFVGIENLNLFSNPELAYKYSTFPSRSPYNMLWFAKIAQIASRTNARSMLTGQVGNATISYSGPYSFAERLKNILRKYHRLLLNCATLRSPLEELSLARKELLTLSEYLAPSTGLRTFKNKRFYKGFLCNRFENHHLAYHGIEKRVPAADVRIIEFIQKLDRSYFYANGTNRYLGRAVFLKNAPEGIQLMEARGNQAADWREVWLRSRTNAATFMKHSQNCKHWNKLVNTQEVKRLLSAGNKFDDKFIYRAALPIALNWGIFLRRCEDRKYGKFAG